VDTAQGGLLGSSQPIGAAVLFETGSFSALTFGPAFHFGNLARMELIIHFGQFELDLAFPE
jgi:hypothetical protein